MFYKFLLNNKKIIIYSFIYATIIFSLQSESLGDRSAYISMIKNSQDIINSAHNNLISTGNLFKFITSENLWQYILISLKAFNLNPTNILNSISCIIGFLTSYFVFRNCKNNMELAFIYLINIFTLTSSMLHIRSGLAMCLVFMTYDFPYFNKSRLSKIIRFLAVGIHMGALIYLLIDLLQNIILKINNSFGRLSVIIFGFGALLSSNLLFALLTKYKEYTFTSGKGSFFGFAFYLAILILIILTDHKQRKENLISIIILSTYVSFYYSYPAVSRVLQMGFPFLIISIINIKTSSKKLLTLLFLLGNIFSLILNYKLLFV